MGQSIRRGLLFQYTIVMLKGNSTRVGKVENVPLLLDTMSMMLIEIFVFEQHSII